MAKDIDKDTAMDRVFYVIVVGTALFSFVSLMIILEVTGSIQ